MGVPEVVQWLKMKRKLRRGKKRSLALVAGVVCAAVTVDIDEGGAKIDVIGKAKAGNNIFYKTCFRPLMERLDRKSVGWIEVSGRDPEGRATDPCCHASGFDFCQRSCET